MWEIFRSVEDIWLIWLLCVFVLGWVARRFVRGFQVSRLRQFWRSEQGASYALPYVLTFPFLLLLVALLLQCTFILVCKFGNLYAAYSAARTVTVWQSAYSADERFGDTYTQFKAKRSAVMAMVPFANSSTRARKRLFPGYPLLKVGDITDGKIDLPDKLVNLLTEVDRRFYTAAYKRMETPVVDGGAVKALVRSPSSTASPTYISNKYHYSAAATTVEFPQEVVSWNDDLNVTVRYRMAFHIPVTGRMLGGKKPIWSYFFSGIPMYRDIESTVTIASEAGRTDDGTVGIPYDPSSWRSIIPSE